MRQDTSYEAGQLSTLLFAIGLPVQQVCSISNLMQRPATLATLTRTECSELREQAARLEVAAAQLRKIAVGASPVFLQAAE